MELVLMLSPRAVVILRKPAEIAHAMLIALKRRR